MRKVAAVMVAVVTVESMLAVAATGVEMSAVCTPAVVDVKFVDDQRSVRLRNPG